MAIEYIKFILSAIEYMKYSLDDLQWGIQFEWNFTLNIINVELKVTK